MQYLFRRNARPIYPGIWNIISGMLPPEMISDTLANGVKLDTLANVSASRNRSQRIGLIQLLTFQQLNLHWNKKTIGNISIPPANKHFANIVKRASGQGLQTIEIRQAIRV